MDGWIDAVEAEARGRKKERERKKRGARQCGCAVRFEPPRLCPITLFEVLIHA